MSVPLFSGFQTQTPRVSSHTKTALDFWLGRKTVQGAIEEAILKLRPRNEPILVGSSRYICSRTVFHHCNIIRGTLLQTSLPISCHQDRHRCPRVRDDGDGRPQATSEQHQRVRVLQAEAGKSSPRFHRRCDSLSLASKQDCTHASPKRSCCEIAVLPCTDHGFSERAIRQRPASHQVNLSLQMIEHAANS